MAKKDAGSAARTEATNVDWSKPILYWDEILAIMGGSEDVVKKECRKLVPCGICFKRYDGDFVAHREKFVEYIGSGHRITERKTSTTASLSSTGIDSSNGLEAASDE